MTITLIPSQKADIPFVLDCEAQADAAPFIFPWSADQHLQALQNADCVHRIAVDAAGVRLGFSMLFGRKSEHRSLELRRIVVADKHRGTGRRMLARLQQLAFLELGAHRLWLDVKQQNTHARQLYRSMGFVEEGVLRECLTGPGDTRESLVLMAMLRHEYAG
ncbi:MAG: hypothetical protein BSR46_05370 [Candidatus Dactylopiibacterium carminicum]|nr:GNAT family N-acetyltransferase [Candidatus Dactylopiibacterium carminicum]PAS99924.1 MAG: hypothetical protein BSR46_05370 [Candidatus Dactylopiibacterium carminicum]